MSPVKKIADWKYLAFFWLDLDKWNVDRILTWHTVDGKKYCKVCDLFVEPGLEEKHVAKHVREATPIFAAKRKEDYEKLKEQRLEAKLAKA